MKCNSPYCIICSNYRNYDYVVYEDEAWTFRETLSKYWTPNTIRGEVIEDGRTAGPERTQWAISR